MIIEKAKLTLGIIQDMQHCIGFTENRVTGTKHRVMHAFRNHYCDHKDNENWKILISLGLAKANLNDTENSIVYFRLTPEGFKFLADLCGFEKIIEID